MNLKKITVALLAVCVMVLSVAYGQSAALTDTVIYVKPQPDTTAAYLDGLSRLSYEQEPKIYAIGKLTASGLRSLNPDLILGTTGLAVGDSIYIPGDALNLAARRLWGQNHFSDVKVETKIHGDVVDVNIHLQERRRVSQWAYEGVKSGVQKDLNEKLKLRRNGELSDYRISTSLKLIRSYFDEKGFRNAKIDYKIEDDPTKPTNAVVTFVIDRGKRVRIKEIEFEGNEAIADKKLTKALKNTHKKGINFFRSTKYKEEEFDKDRQGLKAYYRSKGYRDIELVADSIYDIDEKNIGLWIKVDEGKKYYYRNISWLGNSVYQTAALNNLLQVQKGDTYDSETMGTRLGTIQGEQGETSVQGLYMDDGYLAFRIEPVETVVGDSVDVQIRIVEGKQFRIKNVTFEGNSRTNDHVVRRELYTRPGELFNQSLLIRTYQRLASMGQFEPESFQAPAIVPDMQQETVDIKYSFKERSNDQFELSGGWGGGMFIASVGIRFTNISLRNFFKKDAWRPYPAGDNQSLAISVQSNGTYYQAGSISFSEPWLGGKKPNSLSLNFYTSRETDAYYWSKPVTQSFGTIGGSVGFGKRLTWPDPYFSISAGITAQSYNMMNWRGFALQNGRANTIALNFAIGRNSVDDPMLYSTSGSDISLSLAITPPYSSFDGKDYSDPNMPEQDRHRWIEYHKWNFNAKWFFPLTADRKLVLMTKMQLGFLGFFNKYKQSPFEGFQVGGDGLSGYSMYGIETVGLRGYENSSLTPLASQGLYANVFSKYAVELRYPLVRETSTMIYALAFAEAGNAYQSIKNYNPFDLKRSLGIGIRVYLPMIGLIGLDWGYGFDRLPMSGKRGGSQLHFMMGTQW